MAKFKYSILQILGCTEEEKKAWEKKSLSLGHHTLSAYLRDILKDFKHEGLEGEIGLEKVLVSSCDFKYDFGEWGLKSKSIRYFINREVKK